MVKIRNCSFVRRKNLLPDLIYSVSPSKKLWMQNRTKAWGLYYFPSSWMYPLDVQNGCALEHSLRVNSVSHPMKTSHPTKKYRYIGLRRMSPIWGTIHFCNDPCKKPSVKMTFLDSYHEQHWHEFPKHLQSPHLEPHGLHQTSHMICQNDPCTKPSVKMTIPDLYHEQNWHELSRVLH